MAIEFSTNIPRTVKFPYGDFKKIESEYGVKFLYTVEQDGTRDRLFATPKLHQQLQEAGMRAGAVFTITKIEVEGNRKDWKIEAQEQHGNASQPATPTPEKSKGETPAANGKPANGQPAQEAPAPAPAAPTASSKNGAPPADSPGFHDLKQAMQHCLNSSYEVWERLDIDLPFTSEDVRTVGITLFLECSRKGIVPQATEELPF